MERLPWQEDGEEDVEDGGGVADLVRILLRDLRGVRVVRQAPVQSPPQPPPPPPPREEWDGVAVAGAAWGGREGLGGPTGPLPPCASSPLQNREHPPAQRGICIRRPERLLENLRGGGFL